MATQTVGTLDYNEIVFPRLGIELHVDSTAFTIGDFSIQWYGILITLGLVLAMAYAFTQVKKYGLNPDRVIDAVIGGIVGGIIGARAYYVLMEWDNYAGDWKSIFNLREGGLAIYGGIIGALAVGCLVAKLRKVRILPLLDIAGIGFLLGQGIGRWGNFFNQEAFGCNTTSLFGMSGGRIQEWITNQYPNTTYYANFGTELDPSLPVHPCFLYESLWCLLGFVLLALFAKKIRKFDGQIFLIYIGWYGLERAFVEGLRTDSLVIGNVRISQLLAILCVATSIILQAVFLSRVKRMGSDYRLYKDTEESKQLMAYAGKAPKDTMAETSAEMDMEVSEAEPASSTEEALVADEAPDGERETEDTAVEKAVDIQTESEKEMPSDVSGDTVASDPEEELEKE